MRQFLDSVSKQASDRYEEFSNSPWGTVYDVVNAGLYVAAPFTGGATLVPAIGMSVVQGLAGANNMYQKGANLNNTLDVVGGLVAAPGKAVAKPIMKTVGKSTKYVKRMPLVTKNAEVFWQLNLYGNRQQQIKNIFLMLHIFTLIQEVILDRQEMI